MGGYSTYKNKQEMWNNDFSFEASFSKKSSLKVRRICVRLSNSELNRDNTINGYSMRKNKSNRAFSFEISISEKLTFSFSVTLDSKILHYLHEYKTFLIYFTFVWNLFRQFTSSSSAELVEDSIICSWPRV